MKKIFAFVAASLMLVSFASCDKKGGNEPEPEVKNFEIQVSNVEAKSVSVKVVPADVNVTYYWDIFVASEAAKMTDAQIAEAFKENFDEVIAYYAQYGYELTYDSLLVKGENSYDFSKLEPNTEYVVVALELDENIAAKGTSVRKTFKTLEEKEDPVPADMTFNIAVDSLSFSGAYIAVTPSNNEATYYWSIYKSEAIAGLTDAQLCAGFKSEIEETIEYYGYFGYDLTIEDFLSKGPDAYKYNSLDANTAYTAVAVAMGSLGTCAGAVAKYNFETPELVAESTEDITIENAKMADACDAYGWWQMMAMSADSTFYLTVSPEEAATVEGSYTIDDMDADFTYVLLDKEDQYKFAKLDVEVAVDGENFTFTGTGIAMNAVEYHFNISGIVEVSQASAAPARAAKKAPAAKSLKAIKKGNLAAKKNKFVSEKLYNR